MHSWLLFIIALQLAGKVTSIRPRQLTDETGDIFANSGERAYYKIRAAKRRRIVISVNSVSLSANGYLKLRDGVSGEERTFKRFGFGIYETTSSGRISGDAVPLPIKMTTLTRKLFVQYYNEDGDGLSAHYTSYNEEKGCGKDRISMEAGGRQITTVNCDADELSPVASECVVTVACAPTHVQYNDQITCRNGDWTGKFDCKPRQDLIDDCVFDFNNLNENESNSCPYTPAEIAHYYIDVKDVIISSTQALRKSSQGFGRSSQAAGRSSPVFGRSSKAAGRSSQAFGRSSQAAGRSSQAFGRSSQAFRKSFQAPRGSSQAFVGSSQAAGRSSQAFGKSSQTPRRSSQASGRSSQVLERSTQMEVKCGNVCKAYGNGKYVVNCNNPRNNKQRVRCYICRLVYKCKHHVVFF